MKLGPGVSTAYGIAPSIDVQALLQRSATLPFRLRDPAANAAAEAIVMYPTNREDAPGLK